MFRKLEFVSIYYAYMNKLPFKYYISILGGGGSEATLILLISGKPAYIILARSLIVAIKKNLAPYLSRLNFGGPQIY